MEIIDRMQTLKDIKQLSFIFSHYDFNVIGYTPDTLFLLNVPKEKIKEMDNEYLKKYTEISFKFNYTEKSMGMFIPDINSPKVPLDEMTELFRNIKGMKEPVEMAIAHVFYRRIRGMIDGLLEIYNSHLETPLIEITDLYYKESEAGRSDAKNMKEEDCKLVILEDQDLLKDITSLNTAKEVMNMSFGLVEMLTLSSLFESIDFDQMMYSDTDVALMKDNRSVLNIHYIYGDKKTINITTNDSEINDHLMYILTNTSLIKSTKEIVLIHVFLRYWDQSGDRIKMIQELEAKPNMVVKDLKEKFMSLWKTYKDYVNEETETFFDFKDKDSKLNTFVDIVN